MSSQTLSPTLKEIQVEGRINSALVVMMQYQAVSLNSLNLSNIVIIWNEANLSSYVEFGIIPLGTRNTEKVSTHFGPRYCPIWTKAWYTR